MKTLFLSHRLHPVHRTFAQSIHARIQRLDVEWFTTLVKRWRSVGLFYYGIAALYSLGIRCPEEYIVADGGTALYIAYFLKKRKPSLRVILLNSDLFFYSVLHQPSITSRWIVSCIDGAISVSEQNDQYLQQYHPTPSYIVYPFAIYVSTKKTIQREERSAVYAGRLDPEKHIERVISYVTENEYIQKLYIVGDGTLRTWVETQQSVHQKIEYIGFQDHVQEYYQRAELFIHLPDYDPCPVSVFEAATSGCIPILSHGVGNASFFDKRFILTSLSSQAFAAHVRSLITNRDQTLKILKKNVEHFPTKETSCNQFVEHYQSLCSY